jgi:hypothetical protein
MRPFIVKYASEPARSDEAPTKVEYSVTVESTVVAGTSYPVVNDRLIAIELSGSLVTQAQGDPTTDEPTDR